MAASRREIIQVISGLSLETKEGCEGLDDIAISTVGWHDWEAVEEVTTDSVVATSRVARHALIAYVAINKPDLYRKAQVIKRAFGEIKNDVINELGTSFSSRIAEMSRTRTMGVLDALAPVSTAPAFVTPDRLSVDNALAEYGWLRVAKPDIYTL